MFGNIFEGIRKKPTLEELERIAMESDSLPDGFGENLAEVVSPEASLRTPEPGPFQRPGDTGEAPSGKP